MSENPTDTTEKTDSDDKGKSRGLSRTGFRFLLRYLRPYRGKFLIAVTALLISSLAGLAFPWLTGRLIDAVENPGPGWLDDLNRIALAVLAALLLQSLFSYIRTYFIMEVSERSLADVRRDLYDRMIRLPMDFFHRSRVGDLSSRLSSDVTTIQTTLTTTLSELIRQTVILVGGIAFVAYTSPRLTLLILIPVPILVALAVFFGRSIRRESKRVQQMQGEMNTVVEETFQGIGVVKSFTAEKRESARYFGELDRMVNASLRVARARGAFVAFIIFVLFGGIVGVIWYGGTQVREGALTIGELTSFVLYAVFVGGAMGSFADLYSSLQRALGAGERIREILDAQAAEPLNDVFDAGERIRGAIEFDNVAFAYPSRPGRTVLESISIGIPAGGSLALVGPSGSGKTTLAGLLMRFYEPISGRLLLDGRDAADYDLSFYRSAIAMVPQDVLLFGGTIAENIAYGRPGVTEEELQQAARLANAHDFIMSFPDGYDTIVGERGVQLSGGQRQRVAIARAIIKDPAILILDEATSFLDAESERLVQEALEQIMQGRTTVVIAHRLSTIRTADAVAVVRDGRIIEQGSYSHLLEQGGVFARLVELQQRVGSDLIDEDLLS